MAVLIVCVHPTTQKLNGQSINLSTVTIDLKGKESIKMNEILQSVSKLVQHYRGKNSSRSDDHKH